MKSSFLSLVAVSFLLGAASEARVIDCKVTGTDTLNEIEALNINLTLSQYGKISIKRKAKEITSRDVYASTHQYYWYESRVLMSNSERTEVEGISLVSYPADDSSNKKSWFLRQSKEILIGSLGCIPNEDYQCFQETVTIREIPMTCTDSAEANEHVPSSGLSSDPCDSGNRS